MSRWTGRFPGYPPGFLAAIDKAVQVLSKNRIPSATDWLELIRRGEEETTEPAAQMARPVTMPQSSVVASNMGYIIGAGLVFVAAAGFGLWSLLG